MRQQNHIHQAPVAPLLYGSEYRLQFLNIHCSITKVLDLEEEKMFLIAGLMIIAGLLTFFVGVPETTSHVMRGETQAEDMIISETKYTRSSYSLKLALVWFAMAAFCIFLQYDYNHTHFLVRP